MSVERMESTARVLGEVVALAYDPDSGEWATSWSAGDGTLAGAVRAACEEMEAAANQRAVEALGTLRGRMRMSDIADCLGLSLSAVSSWWSRRQVSWWERERLIAMAQEVAS